MTARPATVATRLNVGTLCLDRKTQERVRICKVTRDFIEWRDEASLSHGRMLACYFLDFYHPVPAR